MFAPLRNTFISAAKVNAQWGARPWGAYRPSSGPVVPGAQPKICVVFDEARQKFVVPVREEDTPEFRAEQKAFRVEEGVAYITSKSVADWGGAIAKYAQGLHVKALELADGEIPEVMSAIVERLLDRPEIAPEPDRTVYARAEYL